MTLLSSSVGAPSRSKQTLEPSRKKNLRLKQAQWACPPSGEYSPWCEYDATARRGRQAPRRGATRILNFRKSFLSRRVARGTGTVGSQGSLLEACSPGARPLGPAPGKSATTDLKVWYAVERRFDWLDASLTDFNAFRGSDARISRTQQAGASRLVRAPLITTTSGGLPDLVDLDQSFIGRILRFPDMPLVAFNDRRKGAEGAPTGPALSTPRSKDGRFCALGNELRGALFGYCHHIWRSTGVSVHVSAWGDVMVAGKDVISMSPDGLSCACADPRGHSPSPVDNCETGIRRGRWTLAD